MHATATLSYFCAHPGRSFWEWDADDGNSTASIHWPTDQQLIIFRPELESLLEGLLLQGFPPLGSILLVIDALRPNWTSQECFERLAATMASISGEKELLSRSRTLVGDLTQRLDFLHRLPANLAASGPARQRLLRTLFEGCHGLLDPAESRVVLGQFVQTPYISVFAQRSPGLNGVARFLKDLQVLSKAFDQCPPEQIEARLQSGTEETPGAAIELPIPKLQGPADLIKALEAEGGELAQVAGLARKLNAMLHVPKAIVQPQGLPVGGVTDITTRGDPSQLLVTELAWDDLTFAARLSQGEALYLRREAPPAEPPQQRILLIDTGIFLWGKPRLFALGAALALLGQRRHATCRVYVLGTYGFEPTAFDTVELVRTHLGRLLPSPHAGPALAELADAADSPFKGEGEIIFISHPSAQESINRLPVWRRLCETSAIHTLLVDRNGNIEFSRHRTTGARVISKVHVEAEDLFETPKRTLPPAEQMHLALSDTGEMLPRFYKEEKWPLLHPAPPKLKLAFQLPGGRFIGVSTHGCICIWSAEANVGRVLLPNPPAKKLFQANRSSDKICLLFLDADHKSTSAKVVTISESNCKVSSIHSIEIGASGRGGLPDFAFPCWQSDCLIIHLDCRSDAYSGENGGKLIASVPHQPGRGWPVFDGEKFHMPTANQESWQILDQAHSIPTQHSQRQFIRRVHSAGFGTTGVLMIMTEGGHTYRLNSHGSGLAWEGRRLPGDIFHKLHAVSHPKWEELELSMCEFPDGRRVVYDPRGYLHVCEGNDEPEELSITLVKGHTAAWSARGRYYGELNLLDGNTSSPMTELVPVMHRLFQASDKAQNT